MKHFNKIKSISGTGPNWIGTKLEAKNFKKNGLPDPVKSREVEYFKKYSPIASLLLFWSQLKSFSINYKNRNIVNFAIELLHILWVEYGYEKSI